MSEMKRIIDSSSAICVNDLEKMENNTYYLRDNLHKAGRVFSMHWHTQYEIEIIINGEVEYKHNMTSFTAKRGDIFFIPTLNMHYLKMLTDTRMMSITFTESMLHPELALFLSQHSISNHYNVDDDTLFTIIGIMDMLKEEYENKNTFKKAMETGLISELMIMLIRRSENITTNEQPLLIQKIVKEINMNFKSDISVEALADKFDITPYYLGKIFKQNVKMSFNDYLNAQRLRFACDLLVETDLTLSEIAEKSGYHSSEYFIYVFKKFMLITPTKYRKMYTNENMGLMH